jgi:leader peptidase (prepilin peptidase)/N-methyltransferase
MMRLLGTVFAGLLGLAFGSFLNVCVSRWPAGESVVTPRSHCRGCNRTLAWWENLPLVSWIALRGRCRTCRAWIGWRYPLVELAVGGLWAQAFWDLLNEVFLDPDCPLIYRYDSVIFVIGKMIFYWLLITLAVFDAENLWLPNWITWPGTALGFMFILTELLFIKGFIFLNFYYLAAHVFHADFPFFKGIENGQFCVYCIALKWFLGILAAAGLILLIRWLYWLIRRREGIGLGDVKLMAMLAAWLGLPGALLAFGMGVVLGALVAVVLLAIPAARSESGGWALKKLPLGTFLCVGGIVSSLWGQQILAAYLRWAGF